MFDNIFGNLIHPEDRLARAKASLEGVKHLYRRIPLDPLPGQPISLFLSTGGDQPYDFARCYFTIDGTDPALSTANMQELGVSGADWEELTWDYNLTWKTEIPPLPAGTLLRYHLAAHQADSGKWIFADNQSEVINESDIFSLWIDNDPVPAWSRQALVYHVFIDRFFPGTGKSWNKTASLNDFHGGTLRGVSDKLDYLQALGFNTIWLSPFFKTSSHHGYDASDYYTVEPRLGTNADLEELIRGIHARGMRVLLDFVANHWSKDHPTFQDAQKNQDSPYHDWYIWKHWPDEYECYFTARSLPKLNLKNGPTREYLLDVARYWLMKGFDGFRLDFAYGPSHDFWVDFRRACREIKPDCWIFGEVVHTPEIQRSYSGIMDGTLDFHLARAIRETFAQQRMLLSEFEAFLKSHEEYFPNDFSRPSFLDNHDMSRFLYMAGNNKEKLKLAALLLYSLSGPPIIYNGTESGTTQERPMQQGKRYIFEEARMPVKWDSEADSSLLEFFTRLAALRLTHPVLWEGSRRLVYLDSDDGIYAFSREGKGAKVLIAINLSPIPHMVSLKAEMPPGSMDKLNNQPIQILDKEVRLNLPGYGCAFICS